MNNSETVINSAIALLVAAVLGTIFTYKLIPFLKKHQFSQFEREVGPKSHQGKSGTPSMGGFAIIGSFIIATLAISIAAKAFSIGTVAVIVMTMLYGLIGFIDDYKKAIKKNNAGISGKMKIALQFAFGILFAVFAYYFSGDFLTPLNTGDVVSNSAIWIPFFNKTIELGLWYIPYVIFVMIAFSNSVNLTDGVDGLSSTVTVIVSLTMVTLGTCFDYKDYPIIYGALAGALLGFLIFNHNPAKVFMGDTGSMAIGGLIASAAVLMKLEFLLAISGLIYVIESISVIIQVGYFKISHGKRVFKMAPIHHHFEMCGRSEKQVVRIFGIFTIILSMVALIPLFIK